MNYKKWKRKFCYGGMFLALFLICYSCLKDEWAETNGKMSKEFVKGRNRELTVDVARSWYEAEQPLPVIATRSVDTQFELLTKLNWEKAEESRLERFEVVEIPLLLKAGSVIIDDETIQQYTQKDRGKIRNISRMVIIKNIETGEIIHFIMHITGSYNYLMTAKHFEDNCYLLRDNQLSGSVYFYKPEGGLINGWRYKDGKIVATIRQGTTEGVEMQKDAGTRFYTPCHFETVWIEYNDCDGFIYNDPEYGLGFGSECQKRYKAETVEVCDGIYVDDDGNEHDWFPDTDSGNGGGGVSNGGDNKTEAEPLPEKVKELIEKNQNLDKKDLDSLCSFIDKMSDECEDCGNCGDYALYTGLTSYNFKFNEVLKEAPKNNASAAYRPEKGNLVFYTTGNLNYNSFTHEMFHLFQHKFKGKYIEEERGFMEYERTLFDDIIFFVKILKGNWSDYNKFDLKKNPWVYNGEKTEDNNTTKNYKKWLSEITNGGTKIPTELNAKELLTYAQFYGKVNISYNKSKYNYDESVGYRFNAIIELLRIANSKCK